MKISRNVLGHLFSITVIALSVTLCVLPLAAQFTTASLGGTVTDPTGAVVPDATVAMNNVDTGLTATVSTEPTGAYLFSRLPIGNYELSVEKTGFSTYVQTGITLTVNQAASQDVTLQVGQVTEQVTVEAAAELIVTRTATAGQLVDQKRIVELPLNGRRPERLMYLSAGTVDLGRDRCRICGHGGVYPGEETAGVNGAGIGQVNFQLDGTGHNDTYINVSLPFPNPDSVQEFNLQSSNFTAEYGNAAGGIVNVVTKSGTNELHGSLFHFLRNGNLNSRNFFAPKQDVLKRNQFGGSAGGPIVKDKLFFFGTYQGTLLRNVPGGIVSFVPTAAERGGDYSSVSKQLVDPVSKEPLLNNQIPASRFSPVSNFFLDRIPLPNGPGRRVTFPGAAIAQEENQFMTKFDYVEGRHQLTGRYYFTDFDAPPEVGPANILSASTAGNAVRVQNISINYTFAASPTLLINSTFGLNRQRGGSLSSTDFGFADAGAKVIGPESIEGLNSPPELVVTVTDGFRIRTNHLGDFDRGDFTVRQVVTKIAGAHELRIGGEAVRVSNHIINTFQMAGQISFNGQLSGFGLSDFMFGRASNFRQGGGEFKDLKGTKWGFFLQDNWRVNSRLNLNLGIRWDPFIPYYDREGRVVCYQPGTSQRSGLFPNAPLGFLFGGDVNPDAGCPQAGFENRWGNFGPRLGLAYRLTEDGKTSLRMGGGIYYTPIQTSSMNPFTNIAPFAGTFSLNDVAFEDPFGSKGRENPFPNNFGNTLPDSDFVFSPINDIRRYFALDLKVPQLITWNVRLERQLGSDTVVSLAYLGNKGTFLHISPDENVAVFRPGTDANGNPLSTLGNIQARRLDPTFSRVRRADAGANSNYHAFQWNLEKRFSRGYSILTNYTWSKTLDNLDNHPFDRRSRYGLAREDIEQNFKFSNLYDLPRANATGFAGKILNGWQVNSIVTWQSGFPFGVSSGRRNSFTGARGELADFSGGNPDLGNQSHGQQVLRYFNTSLFSASAFGTFGNSGRNILRGPRFFNADFGLLKITSISEGVNLQFRTEFFNLFNNVNFRFPNNNASSSNVGKITAVINDSQRIIQFGLKLTF